MRTSRTQGPQLAHKELWTACCVALGRPLIHRCTLPSPSAAQPTEQELGEDRDGCSGQLWRGPHGLIGRREGDKGGLSRGEPGGCLVPWAAAPEFSHVVWKEVFGSSWTPCIPTLAKRQLPQLQIQTGAPSTEYEVTHSVTEPARGPEKVT